VDSETISSQQMLAIAGVLMMVALVQTGSQPLTGPGKRSRQEAEPQLAVVPTPEISAPASMVSPESQVA
jgi:hypothetical protein